MTESTLLRVIPPQLGKTITESVTSFAEKRGLRPQSWVQDRPLWFLTSPDRSRGIVQRLQIGAYTFGTSHEVRIIPEVLRFAAEPREVSTYEQIDLKNIVICPFDTSREQFDVALATAWETAQKLPPPGPMPETSSSGPSRRSEAITTFRVSPDFRV